MSLDHGDQDGAEDRRCGLVALLGAPNAGKSTLLNTLVGSKISIVTHKVQTTRARVRAVATEGDTQLVFVDTPGIFTPKRRLERAMVATAWAGAEDADLSVLLCDAARKDLEHELDPILEGLRDLRGPVVLALNKIDLIERERLLALAARLGETGLFSETFMISAVTGDGVADLREYLAKAMPQGPWLYPEDQLSDLPLRLHAAEVTREKLFLHLHQELPYNLTVETESWEEKADGSVRIAQTIVVQKDSHKAMVIGKSGKTIKLIREKSQKEMEAFLEQKIHLFLFVKVRRSWLDDPERYRPWGLPFDV